MKGNKNNIIIIGKLPPPYFGPAIATKIILESSLSKEFNLIHVDSRVNTSMNTMGKIRIEKFFIIIKIYFRFLLQSIKLRRGIVLIPIAQETSGLLKDFIFFFIAKLSGHKVIIHLRGSSILNWYQKASHPMKVLYRMLTGRSDAAIVLGENLRYLFEGFIQKEKIFVVPNGADYNIPIVAKEGKIKILFFANFHQNKGLLDFLMAVDSFDNDLIDKIEVNLCGNWKADNVFVEQCKAIINKQPGLYRIHENLWGERKYNIYAVSDIFVFPPNKPEGHPWVIVEALAAGLPVISTDMGAITESVIDNYNGYIVEPNSPCMLAEKILNLCNDRELRERMGNNSRSLYLSNFTEKIMVERLAKIFHSLDSQSRLI